MPLAFSRSWVLARSCWWGSDIEQSDEYRYRDIREAPTADELRKLLIVLNIADAMVGEEDETFEQQDAVDWANEFLECTK